MTPRSFVLMVMGCILLEALVLLVNREATATALITPLCWPESESNRRNCRQTCSAIRQRQQQQQQHHPSSLSVNCRLLRVSSFPSLVAARSNKKLFRRRGQSKVKCGTGYIPSPTLHKSVTHLKRQKIQLRFCVINPWS